MRHRDWNSRIELPRQRAALARMNIALLRQAQSALFRTIPIADGLALRFILNHLFVWEVEGRPGSVSRVARALGMSRATAKRRLGELITLGYVERMERSYVMTDKINLPNQRQVLCRMIAVLQCTLDELSLCDESVQSGQKLIPLGLYRAGARATKAPNVVNPT